MREILFTEQVEYQNIMESEILFFLNKIEIGTPKSRKRTLYITYRLWVTFIL